MPYRSLTCVVLPQLLLLSAVTCYSADRFVSAGQSIQAAVDQALPGDTITLQAGAVFRGQVRLRKKTGTAWITIRTSAMASLPPAGTRVAPTDRIHMPKLVADLPYPVFKAEP